LGLWCLTPLSAISWRSVLFVESSIRDTNVSCKNTFKETLECGKFRLFSGEEYQNEGKVEFRTRMKYI